MQAVIYKPSLPGVDVDKRQPDQILNSDVKINCLFTPLTQKGLDRLTDSEIEHIICTSALAAFF